MKFRGRCSFCVYTVHAEQSGTRPLRPQDLVASSTVRPAFTCPLKNSAKRLKSEIFNSVVYTCLVTNWLDEHIDQFLTKFTNITNSFACIVRSFRGLD